MIVAPARDTPGIIARIWQQPTASDVASDMFSTSWTRGRGRTRSIKRIRKPPTIRLTATTHGENNTSLMMRYSSTPAIAAGRKAMTMLATKCCAGCSLSMPEAARNRRTR